MISARLLKNLLNYSRVPDCIKEPITQVNTYGENRTWKFAKGAPVISIPQSDGATGYFRDLLIFIVIRNLEKSSQY